jgi:hypothetical protein
MTVILSPAFIEPRNQNLEVIICLNYVACENRTCDLLDQVVHSGCNETSEGYAQTTCRLSYKRAVDNA